MSGKAPATAPATGKAPATAPATAPEPPLYPIPGEPATAPSQYDPWMDHGGGHEKALQLLDTFDKGLFEMGVVVSKENLADDDAEGERVASTWEEHAQMLAAAAGKEWPPPVTPIDVAREKLYPRKPWHPPRPTKEEIEAHREAPAEATARQLQEAVDADDFDEAERLQATLDGQEAAASGRRVRIQGLRSAVEFNGRLGKVTGFDAETGRYAVGLDGGGGVRAKRPNVQFVDSEAGSSSDPPPTEQSAADAAVEATRRQVAEIWSRSGPATATGRAAAPPGFYFAVAAPAHRFDAQLHGRGATVEAGGTACRLPEQCTALCDTPIQRRTGRHTLRLRWAEIGHYTSSVGAAAADANLEHPLGWQPSSVAVNSWGEIFYEGEPKGRLFDTPKEADDSWKHLVQEEAFHEEQQAAQEKKEKEPVPWAIGYRDFCGEDGRQGSAIILLSVDTDAKGPLELAITFGGKERTRLVIQEGWRLGVCDGGAFDTPGLWEIVEE